MRCTGWETLGCYIHAAETIARGGSSTCPLRHVCNASIAFFAMLFQRGGKRARGERERERSRLSTFPRWNSRACAEPRQAEDEDVTRTTTGPLFFRVASFPRRCGRSLGIKFLGRSCDQVNMHFFFCPLLPCLLLSCISLSPSLIFLLILPSSSFVIVLFLLDFCTRNLSNRRFELEKGK